MSRIAFLSLGIEGNIGHNEPMQVPLFSSQAMLTSGATGELYTAGVGSAHQAVSTEQPGLRPMIAQNIQSTFGTFNYLA